MHERDDEYEGQEDGEYHFSDDQANYDAEPEAARQAAPAVAPAKPAGGGGINQYRRPIIGVGVFIFLIFLVYKILAPSSSGPTADFVQNSVTTSKKVLSQHQANTGASEAVASNTASAQAAAEAQRQPAPQPAAPQPIEPIVAQQQIPQAPVLQQEQPSGVAAGEMTPNQASSVVDKLLALQEQNSKLINQLEAADAQKTVSNEAQNNATQGKLQDLSMRITSIEATLTRLGRAIQEMKGGSRALVPSAGEPSAANEAQVASPAASAQMMAKPAPEPKSSYAVQAIIPGRAWLKSDAGETVTVAEGDTLKNYGRIIKIDPYDGVVQIDVGGRTVSLSYGVAND